MVSLLLLCVLRVPCVRCVFPLAINKNKYKSFLFSLTLLWVVSYILYFFSCNHTHTGGYTGKVSWNLGKRYGLSSCTLHLPHTDTDDNEGGDADTTTNTTTTVKEEEVEEFWVALETAANKLLIQSANSNNDNDGSSIVVVEQIVYPNGIQSALSDPTYQPYGGGYMLLDAGQASAIEKSAKKNKTAAAKSEESATAAAATTTTATQSQSQQQSQQQQPQQIQIMPLYSSRVNYIF